jgi:AraC-like DNA-binding protein/uncharacterized protein YneF (UPF0154 family)
LFDRIGFKIKILIYFILAVLSIAIISASFTYFTIRQTMLDDTRNQSVDIIAQLKNFNDMMLRNTVQSLYALASNNVLEGLVARYYTISDYKEKKMVHNQLLGIFNINVYFLFCFVYYPDHASVLDINTMNPVYQPISQNKWKETVVAAYNTYLDNIQGDRLPVYAVSKNGVEDREWMLIIPVNSYYEPNSYPSPNQPMLMISIDSDGFYHNLHAVTIPEGSRIFITDKDGTPVGSSAQDFVVDSALKEQVVKEGNGSLITQINGKRMLLSFVTSDETGWNYFFAVPEDIIYYRLQPLKNGTMLSVFLCITLGLILALILTNRIYIPIKQLSKKIRETPEVSDDAFMVIESGVDTLLSENKLLQQHLWENERILKNIFLKGLLEDTLGDDKSIHKRMAAYGIPFKEGQSLYVLVVSAEPEGENYTGREMAIFSICFEDILHKRLDSQRGVFFTTVKMEKMEIVVIIGIENESLPDAKFLKLLEGIQEALSAGVQFPVVIGCSGQGGNLTKIPELFQKAKRAAEYRFILGGDKVIRFQDILSVKKPFYNYPWELERKIIKNLRQGEIEDVLRNIHDFSDIVQSRMGEPDYCRFTYIHLFVDIIGSLEEILPYDSDELFEDDIYKRILNSQTLAETVYILSEACTKICNFMQLKNSARTDEITGKIRAFIDENYNSPQMSLDFLSDKLHFSVSYISKVFRVSCGLSVKDYITQKRLARSCELLRKTNLHVWEIGQQVGYSQQRSFIEIFKKYKGITPTEYRRIQQR